MSKDTSFSFSMLGVKMNVINLSPKSSAYFLLCIVILYAAIRIINLGIKYTENLLNLQ